MPKAKKSSVKPKVVATHTNSFFKPAESESKSHDYMQNVTVEINIDQKDDCMTGCFKGLASLFKK